MSDEVLPAAPEHFPTVGKGRYRIVAKLGEGGMAAVYRAWDTKLQVWRAIKVLLPEFARKAKLRKRFENEAAVMARLQHRHVISVFDVGTDEPLPYIVMELADGGCLIDWVEAHGAMPARLAVDAVMQVCKGVGAAHELGVIHRDIKPHNVLLTSRGVCKVTDFGIAQVDEGGGMTKTGSVMGTLGYMAPEQRSDAKHVDARADVYAIGATLYKLVTDRSVADLFLAEHDAELLDGVPEVLVPIVLKATAYRPAERYDDVAQLAKALHEAKAALPAIPDGTPPLSVGKAQRPQEVPPQDLSQPTFPEIEEVLEADPNTLRAPGSPAAPPPVTPTAEPTSSQNTPVPQRDKVLPYTMPTPVGRRGASDEMPSYLDPSEIGKTANVVPIELGLDEESRRKDEETRAANAQREKEGKSRKPDDDGSLEVAENFLDLVTSVLMALFRGLQKPIAAFLVPFGGVAAVATVLTAISWWHVQKAHNIASAAQAGLYATLEQEARLVDDLTALGLDRAAVASLYEEIAATEEEPEKMDAALRFVAFADDQARNLGQGGGPVGQTHKIEMIGVRLGRIHDQLARYEDAMLAWEQAGDSTRGQLAITLGIAELP